MVLDDDDDVEDVLSLIGMTAMVCRQGRTAAGSGGAAAPRDNDGRRSSRHRRG